MFNLKDLFKKKNINTVTTDPIIDSADTCSIHEVTNKYQKYVFDFNNQILKNIPPSRNLNGEKVFFEKEKYFDAANLIIEKSGIEPYIKNIVISDSLMDAGDTQMKLENGKLKITIRIGSYQLGIHRDLITEYNSELFNKFISTFAHEIYHAIDMVDIAKTHGIEVLDRIYSDHGHALRAFITFSEYNARRKTAENYGDFDYNERIGHYIDKVHSQLAMVIKDRALNPYSWLIINKINYVIATRSALADASGDLALHLTTSSSNSKTKDFYSYVEILHKSMESKYGTEPLNYREYETLGKQMITDLLIVCLGKDKAMETLHIFCT